MTSKEKATVVIRHFMDGEFKSESEECRYVYTKKDGTMYIHWMDGKAEVHKDETGRIVHDWKCAQLKRVSSQDLINNLLKKAGGPVTIVPLPSDFGTKK